MRAPSKTKDTLSKVLPLRWSFGSKDRRKPDPVPPSVQDPAPVELVQYLESGRRPRCTKDPIVTLMSEPRSTKEADEGRTATNVQSSSVGSISCVGKAVDESPQVPEGQRRPSDKTASLRRSKGNQTRDENTVNVSSSSSSNTLTRRKDAKKQSSSKASQDTETKRSSGAGVQPSYSTPSLHDGTLRRQKGDRGEREHQGTYEGNSSTKKGEVPKSHEGLLSFFKGNFLKKDSRKSKDGDSGKVGGEEGGRRTLSRLSLSNGAAGGGAGVEGGKSNGSGHLGDELANGKVGRTTADIKRSQSSSNIPTKSEQSMRRTASLHRNGMSTTPAPSRSLTADKPSYGTLQRTRYSTTSLGRKRTVPESSFWHRDIYHILTYTQSLLSGIKWMTSNRWDQSNRVVHTGIPFYFQTIGEFRDTEQMKGPSMMGYEEQNEIMWPVRESWFLFSFLWLKTSAWVTNMQFRPMSASV